MEEAIETLASKITGQTSSQEALEISQAILNLQNALCAKKNNR
jgi:hypothetical protein